MKALVFAISLLLVYHSAAWSHSPGAELLDLLNNDDRPAIVAYVLPDDKDSQVFEPEWLSVQQAVKDLHVVSVDCSEEEEFCRGAGVSSFPAIRLHGSGGRQTRYRGPRDAASIQAFLRRVSCPAVSRLVAENATAFESVDDVVFIGRFGGRQTHLLRSLEAAARKYRDRYSFAVSAAPREGAAAPSVTCHNNPDGMQRVLTEFPIPGSIESFVKLCSTPLVPQMTRRNELSFYKTRKSIVHYFALSKGQREEYVAEMRPLSRKYEEYLHFVTADAGEFADGAEMMGLRRGSGGLSVQNPNTGDVYPFPAGDRITASAVEAFLGDIIQGRVKPWRRPDAGHDEL